MGSDLGRDENSCTFPKESWVYFCGNDDNDDHDDNDKVPSCPVEVPFWETAGDSFSKDRIWLDLPALKSH